MASTTQLRQSQNRFSVSRTSAMAISLPTGFQKNLLTNSLTSKLKQRRNNEAINFYNGKENSTINSAKPPKQARKISQRASILVSGNVSESKQIRGDSRISASRTGSGVSSVPSEYATGKSTSRRNPRMDSASSDKLPHLSPRAEREVARFNSRRSSSAGRIAGITSSMSGKYSNSTSFFPNSESTCIFVEPTGADQTIKVVKRDGVFQPLDKYSSGRNHNQRDTGDRTKRVVCDYDVLTLPFGETETMTDYTGTNSALPVSRGRSDVSKKSMRVSWHENADPRFDGNAIDNYITDTNITPVSNYLMPQNSNNNSNNPKDTMAFRKPVHSSGKSSIRSIGLNWTVPTIANDNGDVSCHQVTTNAVTTPVSSSKPMWSWLLAPESKVSSHPRNIPPVQSPNQSTQTLPSSKKKDSLSSSKNKRRGLIPRSSSMLDFSGSYHRRDVHPVATAMDREGTSVSKTKWQVSTTTPSSEFLKQVKDIQSFYKIIPSKRSPHSGPQSQPSGHYHSSRSYGAKVEDKSTVSHEDDGNENDDESTYDDDYNAVMMNAMSYDEDVMTTGTRKDYSNSSPTKSGSDNQYP